MEIQIEQSVLNSTLSELLKEEDDALLYAFLAKFNTPQVYITAIHLAVASNRFPIAMKIFLLRADLGELSWRYETADDITYCELMHDLLKIPKELQSSENLIKLYQNLLAIWELLSIKEKHQDLKLSFTGFLADEYFALGILEASNSKAIEYLQLALKIVEINPDYFLEKRNKYYRLSASIYDRDGYEFSKNDEIDKALESTSKAFLVIDRVDPKTKKDQESRDTYLQSRIVLLHQKAESLSNETADENEAAINCLKEAIDLFSLLDQKQEGDRKLCDRAKAEILYREAMKLYRLHHFDQALPIFISAIELHPAKELYRINYGYCAVSYGTSLININDDQAIELSHRAIAELNKMKFRGSGFYSILIAFVSLLHVFAVSKQKKGVVDFYLLSQSANSQSEILQERMYWLSCQLSGALVDFMERKKEKGIATISRILKEANVDEKDDFLSGEYFSAYNECKKLNYPDLADACLERASKHLLAKDSIIKARVMVAQAIRNLQLKKRADEVSIKALVLCVFSLRKEKLTNSNLACELQDLGDGLMKLGGFELAKSCFSMALKLIQNDDNELRNTLNQRINVIKLMSSLPAAATAVPTVESAPQIPPKVVEHQKKPLPRPARIEEVKTEEVVTIEIVKTLQARARSLLDEYKAHLELLNNDMAMLQSEKHRDTKFAKKYRNAPLWNAKKIEDEVNSECKLEDLSSLKFHWEMLINKIRAADQACTLQRYTMSEDLEKSNDFIQRNPQFYSKLDDSKRINLSDKCRPLNMLFVSFKISSHQCKSMLAELKSEPHHLTKMGEKYHNFPEPKWFVEEEILQKRIHKLETDIAALSQRAQLDLIANIEHELKKLTEEIQKLISLSTPLQTQLKEDLRISQEILDHRKQPDEIKLPPDGKKSSQGLADKPPRAVQEEVTIARAAPLAASAARLFPPAAPKVDKPHAVDVRILANLINQAADHLDKMADLLSAEATDVTYYALFLHLLRCFYLLKEYKRLGGQSSPDIRQDFLEDLRNLMMHILQSEDKVKTAVISSAQLLQKILPDELMRMRKPNLMEPILSEQLLSRLHERYDLSLELYRSQPNPVPFQLDQLPIYQQLQVNHEQHVAEIKNGPANPQANAEQLIAYLEKTLKSIADMTKAIPPQYLFEWRKYSQEIDKEFNREMTALNMLFVFCGELSSDTNHELLKKYEEGARIISFLTMCRNTFRNPLGHHHDLHIQAKNLLSFREMALKLKLPQPEPEKSLELRVAR